MIGPRYPRAFKTPSRCSADPPTRVSHSPSGYLEQAGNNGHPVLRLMGCFVLLYTSRVVCKRRLTMEEIIFSLPHYWRFVDSEALDLKALSWGGRRESRMNTHRTQRSE